MNVEKYFRLGQTTGTEVFISFIFENEYKLSIVHTNFWKFKVQSSLHLEVSCALPLTYLHIKHEKLFFLKRDLLHRQYVQGVQG